MNRSKTFDEVPSRIDKIDSCQPSSDHTAMKLNAAAVVNNEMSETDENWHTVVPHRSNKLPNGNPPTTTNMTSSLKQMNIHVGKVSTRFEFFFSWIHPRTCVNFSVICVMCRISRRIRLYSQTIPLPMKKKEKTSENREKPYGFAEEFLWLCVG